MKLFSCCFVLLFFCGLQLPKPTLKFAKADKYEHHFSVSHMKALVGFSWQIYCAIMGSAKGEPGHHTHFPNWSEALWESLLEQENTESSVRMNHT